MGLPAAYNSTEYFLSKTTLGMGARQSIDPLIYIYPTAYMYILAGLYGVLYISGTVIGIFSNTGDFAIRYLIDPSLFYLAGRVTNILFSLLTVLILYVRSQKLFGETTARFAAVFIRFQILLYSI